MERLEVAIVVDLGSGATVSTVPGVEVVPDRGFNSGSRARGGVSVVQFAEAGVGVNHLLKVISSWKDVGRHQPNEGLAVDRRPQVLGEATANIAADFLGRSAAGVQTKMFVVAGLAGRENAPKVGGEGSGVEDQVVAGDFGERWTGV